MRRRSHRSRHRRTRSRPGAKRSLNSNPSPNVAPPGRKAAFARAFHYLYRLLLKPRSFDEDSRRREYILNVILIGTLIMLGVMGADILIHCIADGSAYDQLSPWLFGAITAFFAGLYALSRRGFFVPAAYLFTIFFLACNTYGAYRWGVKLNASVLGYALLITVSSILVSTRFGMVMTGAVAAIIIPLWHLQYHGILSVQPESTNATDAIVFSFMYAVIMIVAWLSNREIERSLRRARQSESALKEERDMLDIKVEERTRELRHVQLEQVDQLYRFAEFGQLASGLFHDLVNMINATTMRGTDPQVQDRPAQGYRAPALESAYDTQARISRFMQAVRTQLASQDVQESFSVVESVEQAMQLLAYKALDHHVRMRIEKPADPLMLFGNPFRFHQVVVNLAQNALEAFDEAQTAGREVILRLARDANGIRLEVEDNGRGIPDELRERVFEPFFTTRAGSGGMGIGLATAHRIVERDFGGKLLMRPNPRGGTVFAVTIPGMAAPGA